MFHLTLSSPTFYDFSEGTICIYQYFFTNPHFPYRWEFDRKRLFERTTYMSSICADLLTIVEVVNDFLNFLGPELKAVTGDIEGIDSVIQVNFYHSFVWKKSHTLTKI